MYQLLDTTYPGTSYWILPTPVPVTGYYLPWYQLLDTTYPGTSYWILPTWVPVTGYYLPWYQLLDTTYLGTSYWILPTLVPVTGYYLPGYQLLDTTYPGSSYWILPTLVPVTGYYLPRYQLLDITYPGTSFWLRSIHYSHTFPYMEEKQEGRGNLVSGLCWLYYNIYENIYFIKNSIIQQNIKMYMVLLSDQFSILIYTYIGSYMSCHCI